MGLGKSELSGFLFSHTQAELRVGNQTHDYYDSI